MQQVQFKNGYFANGQHLSPAEAVALDIATIMRAHPEEFRQLGLCVLYALFIFCTIVFAIWAVTFWAIYTIDKGLTKLGEMAHKKLQELRKEYVEYGPEGEKAKVV